MGKAGDQVVEPLVARNHPARAGSSRERFRAQEATLELLRRAALVVATMAIGLMAGVFGLYANAIMPGLRQKWVRWNIVRAVISTAALGCLTWALVLTAAVLQDYKAPMLRVAPRGRTCACPMSTNRAACTPVLACTPPWRPQA